MAETKLTEKEETFCQAIIDGLGTVDAYRKAYSENAKESTAWSAACAILQREKVQVRLTELRKPLVQKVQAENLKARDQQIDFIKGRIEICKVNGDESAIIRYTDMLNRIYGVYKESGEGDKTDGKLASVDTETLKKITATFETID